MKKNSRNKSDLVLLNFIPKQHDSVAVLLRPTLLRYPEINILHSIQVQRNFQVMTHYDQLYPRPYSQVALVPAGYSLGSALFNILR
jgi:hypothetical protein